MTTYNPNDFYPSSGKEINSQGNVVTPADGINADGSENVVLVKRNAVQTILANAVPITDTSIHYFPGNVNAYASVSLVDVSGYSDKGVLVYNGTNQSISVNLYGDVNQNPGNTNSRITITSSAVSVAAGATTWLSENTYPILKDPIPYLTVQVVASIAPTSGVVTVYLQESQR